MNSIELLNKMLDKCFQADEKSLYENGICYYADSENMPGIIARKDRIISILLNESELVAGVHYMDYEREYHLDFSVMVKKTFEWEGFSFNELLKWFHEKGHLKYEEALEQSKDYAVPRIGEERFNAEIQKATRARALRKKGMICDQNKPLSRQERQEAMSFISQEIEILKTKVQN